jgi:hypothetical protein
VQISNGELGTGDVNGEVYLGAARQVFDIAVAAMLRATLMID